MDNLGWLINRDWATFGDLYSWPVEQFDSRPPPGPFTPRLSPGPKVAPFRPAAYFYVAFFGGAIALGVVALMNLPRLSKVRNLPEKTYAALALTVAAAIAFLLLAPDDIMSTTRNVRLGLRMIAVAGSILLYKFHKGPAMGTLRSDGEYTSMWKAIGWIVAASIAQGLLIAPFVLA